MDFITRREERYCVESSRVVEFVEEISSIAAPLKFSTGYNQTLYFNNSEHEVPFEISVKARRYSSSPLGDRFELDPDESWNFEIKRDIVSQGLRLRQKERVKSLALKEILKALQDRREMAGTPITSPLQPYVANSYRREHYVVSGVGGDFRITIDDGLAHYFFEDGQDGQDRLAGKQIGRENHARIELKVPQAALVSAEFGKIKSLLEQLGADPIVSKKDAAYNYLSDLIKDRHNKNSGPSDTEIEAKLSLGEEDQWVFHKIKEDIREGRIEGFRQSSGFSPTLEGGKLHRYVIGTDNRCVRISLRGEKKRVISKENSEIVRDHCGLNCILKRRETRGDVSAEFLAMPSKTLYRKRKYFLTEGALSGRTYCVLIDRSTYDGQQLFQMEIEELLMEPSEAEETQAIRDISNLTKQLITRYPLLKPTTLTKWSWLNVLADTQAGKLSHA